MFLLFLNEAESGDAGREMRRIDKLHRKLDYHLVPAAADPEVNDVEQLPAGIRIQPGRLTIEFEGFESFASKLVELSQIMAKDLHRFQALCERK
jgi:hypothetical protein